MKKPIATRYSDEQKESICAEYESQPQMSIKDICNKYKMAKPTFSSWLKRYREGKAPKPKEIIAITPRHIEGSKSYLEEENSLLRSIVMDLTMQLAAIKRSRRMGS